MPEVVRLQVGSMTHNLVTVLRAMTYRTGFAQWYQRHDPSKHPTWINAGLAVTVAIGVGYLLGQLRDPRAAALLLWLGLGLLPGILSQDPADRRIGLVFPALAVIAAVMFAAAARVAGTCCGRWFRRLFAVPLSLLLLLIAWTSIASHLALRVDPIHLTHMIEFTKPVFADSDMILHDLDGTVWLTVVFGNADSLIDSDSPPCLRALGSEESLVAGQIPQCSFNDVGQRSLMSDQQLALLRERFDPQRVTFLFSGAERSRHRIETVASLYPHAARKEYRSLYPEFSLVAFSIDRNPPAADAAPSP